jgi:hypothetical protein
VCAGALVAATPPLTPPHPPGTQKPGPVPRRATGGGTWRLRSGTRRGRCSVRICRPPPPTATRPGTARSATDCCGWRWTPLRRGNHRTIRRAEPPSAHTPEATSHPACDGCHRISF